MANFKVFPSTLQGSLTVPPSKSHTLRAIFFAALGKGVSRIEQFLPSPDSIAMIEAMRAFGAEVKIDGNALEISGFAGKPKPVSDVIQCGNSGIVLRFVGALSALLPSYTVLTGDHSIRHNRPVKPLLQGLSQLGAFATSTKGNDHAPILVKGPITQTKTTLDGQDSQPVSGLLITAAFSPHPIEIHVENPGEKPWIDLTLDWLTRLGIPFERKDYSYYKLNGNAQIEAFNYTVPGDFSTAAFPIAAALLTNSELTLHNVDMNDSQGDKAIIPILKEMGARFTLKDKTLTIHKGAKLKGMKIDLDSCIDALPILTVIGCFAEGKTEIFNAAIARKKESDRISAIATELKKMGAQIEEQEDGLIIHQSLLHGAELHTYHDHRLVASLTIAALAASSPSTVLGTECLAKTYPNFSQDFNAIGARIER